MSEIYTTHDKCLICLVYLEFYLLMYNIENKPILIYNEINFN